MTGTALLPRGLFLLRVVAATALLLGLFARHAAAQPAGFVYALQQVFNATNQIYGFRVDALTGALTPLPGFPVGSGGTGGASSYTTENMVYANGRLYVINDGNDTLSVFTVNRTTGTLTAVAFSPVALGGGSWFCVAVHPSGSPVVVGDGSPVTAKFASFAVTATTATAAAGSPYGTGTARPASCAFSRDGNYVYTGGNGGSPATTIAGFSVAPATGVLTPLPGSPFNVVMANPRGYATDSSGRLFIVKTGPTASGEIRVFTTAAGVPTSVSGNPFASGLVDSRSGLLHPAGFYLAADWGAPPPPITTTTAGADFVGRVGVYAIGGSGAATTVTAVSGSPFTTGGTSTGALALTPDGGLLVAAHDSRNLAVFRVNATTGGLTSLGIQPANTLGATGPVTALTVVPLQPNPFDRDGDAKADLGVYRPSTGIWWILQSAASFTTHVAHAWGASTDIPVSADYDGDRKMDIAVYRPSEGVWYILRSSTNYTTFAAYPWGASTDIPVPGDYDGDGKTDIAVFRPSTGVWWILQSRSNYTTYAAYTWGASTDVVAPADYDGDGRTDVAVHRPSTGEWWILLSSFNYTTYTTYLFGLGDFIAVPGDYDADGRADVAVYRTSTGIWYVLRSSSNYTQFTSYIWGASTDIPVPADYDGDGKPELALYRPSTGVWWLLLSSTNYTAWIGYTWGASTDIPLPRR